MLNQTMTRAEIVSFIKSGRDNDIDESIERGCQYTREQLEAVNDYIDYIVDEFGDPNLWYNAESGYFDYVGPELPQ